MDAHDREYAAAAAAIGDQTPTGCRLPSYGDRVTYRLKGWSDRSGESGRVIRHTCGTDGRPRLVVEVEGSPGQIRVIDPRPWPTGDKLPF